MNIEQLLWVLTATEECRSVVKRKGKYGVRRGEANMLQ